MYVEYAFELVIFVLSHFNSFVKYRFERYNHETVAIRPSHAKKGKQLQMNHISSIKRTEHSLIASN